MRAVFPRLSPFNLPLEQLHRHRVELILFGSMVSSICLVTGAALSVLLNPSLGRQLTPEALLKPGSVQDRGIVTLEDAWLELSKPLKIEVVMGKEPSQPSEALTIVSPAEFQPQLFQEAQRKGTRLLLLSLGAGGLLVAGVRWGPYLPIWPKRRKPLSERLNAQDLPDHPLSLKHLALASQRLVQATSVGRPGGGLGTKRTRTAKHGADKQAVAKRTVTIAPPRPRQNQALLQPYSPTPPAQPAVATTLLPNAGTPNSVPQAKTNLPDWLNTLDVRQETPVERLI